MRDIVVRAVGTNLDEQFEAFADEETPTAQWPPPPVLRMPDSSLVRSLVVFDQGAAAERIFELTGRLSDRPHEVVAQALLEWIRSEAVECAWGSVVRGTVDDEHLVHIAGVGERGHALVGHVAPFRVGLVGAVHDIGLAMRAGPLFEDQLAHLPAEVRGDLEDLVCVPVVLGDGRTWGVIALADVADESPDAALEIVEMVARALGAIVG